MKLVPNAVSSRVARQKLKLDSASPKLLFGVGVASMVGSTVLACRGTLKLSEALEKSRQDMHLTEILKDHEDYSEQDRQSDVARIYVKSAVTVAKLYAPAVGLGIVGIACLTKSHNILSDRNVAITAAYAALESGFSEYRGRVIEKYGEDEDRELRYGSERIEVIDQETGKVVGATRVGPNGASIYARFFDEYSPNWSKEAEYNKLFLINQQNWANDMLKVRGHLFLNEVYDMLGLPHTTAGSVVGWIVSHEGDNYIDFGIFDDRHDIRDFVNGREGSILLDFNVDGVIYDKIDNKNQEKIRWQS
jgi:uncharacterized protein DUF6353